jgi:hypothetical protein
MSVNTDNLNVYSFFIICVVIFLNLCLIGCSQRFTCRGYIFQYPLFVICLSKHHHHQISHRYIHVYVRKEKYEWYLLVLLCLWWSFLLESLRLLVISWYNRSLWYVYLNIYEYIYINIYMYTVHVYLFIHMYMYLFAYSWSLDTTVPYVLKPERIWWLIQFRNDITSKTTRILWL